MICYILIYTDDIIGGRQNHMLHNLEIFWVEGHLIICNDHMNSYYDLNITITYCYQLLIWYIVSLFEG